MTHARPPPPTKKGRRPDEKTAAGPKQTTTKPNHARQASKGHKDKGSE